MPVPYASTHDGSGVVTIPEASGEPARVLSIGVAENLLQHWRKSAWDEAARGGSRYVANSFLAWGNCLADALALAAELRAKEEAKQKKDAA